MRKSSNKMHPLPSSGCVQCAAYGEKFWIRVLWYNFPLVMLFCFSLHRRSGLNCDKNSLKFNNRVLRCLDWACNLIHTGRLNSWVLFGVAYTITHQFYMVCAEATWNVGFCIVKISFHIFNISRWRWTCS